MEKTTKNRGKGIREDIRRVCAGQVINHLKARADASGVYTRALCGVLCRVVIFAILVVSVVIYAILVAFRGV